MRDPTVDCSYYCPLTKQTTRDIFRALFGPLARSESSTFRILGRIGGGKALTDFMMNHVDELGEDTNTPISSTTTKFVYVDIDHLNNGTNRAYISLLYNCLCNSLNIKKSDLSDMTYQQVVSLVRNIVKKSIKKYNITFILRGINYLEFSDSFLWSNIRSLRVNSQKVNFIFVIYDNAPLCMEDPRFERIYDLMIRNVVKFGFIEEADVTYSIKRWEYILETRFTKEDIAAIAEVSQGNCFLIKSCCTALANRPAGVDPMQCLSCREDLKGITRRKKLGSQLKVDISTSTIFVGNKSIGRIFSPGELKVLLLLVKKRGLAVSKWDIAEELWEYEASEKYSEGAIVQIIWRLRKKLSAVDGVDASIISVRGSGYMFE